MALREVVKNMISKLKEIDKKDNKASKNIKKDKKGVKDNSSKQNNKTTSDFREGDGRRQTGENNRAPQNVSIQPNQLQGGQTNNNESSFANKAEIGSLKLLQYGDQGPRVHLKIGNIEIPIKGSFQIQQEDNGLVLVPVGSDQTNSNFISGLQLLGGMDSKNQNRLNQTSSSVPNSAQGESGSSTASPQKEKTQDLRENLNEEYGVSEDQLRDKELQDLEKLEDIIRRRNNLKDKLSEKYGVEESEMEGKSLEELKEFEEELRQREELKDKLTSNFDIDKNELSGKSYSELKKIMERKKSEKDQLLDKLSDKYNYSSLELGNKSLNELKRIKDRAEEKKKVLNELEENYDVNKDRLKFKNLDELKDLKQDLGEIKKEKEKLGGDETREEDVEEITEDGGS